MRRPFFILFGVLLAVALPLTAGVRDEMIVSTEWLAKNLDNVVLLEVGDKALYAESHIPGARFVPLQEIVVDVDGVPNELPPVDHLEATFTQAGVGEKGRLVIYSRQPLNATRTWFTLDTLGAGSRAAILDGGIDKWIAEQRPVSTDVPQVQPAKFTASLSQTTVAKYKVVEQLVTWRESIGDTMVMIDARPPEYYKGEKPGAGVRAAGHIPGACNIPWSANLNTDGTFKADGALKTLYHKVGIEHASTIVTYCRTGMEASMSYFVLRYLGYDPLLYDGSYIEWSRSNSSV
jgi:thiosulfate/3-mercaptopyruvate sulfurtransferase